MKNIRLLFFIVLIISCNSKNDYTFQLQIEGIRFDSLTLVCENIVKDQVKYKIRGELKNRSNWKFSIPDSVYRMARNFYLNPILNDEKQEIKHSFIYLSYQNGDSIIYSNRLPFDRKIVKIHAKYLDTQVYENTPIISSEDGNISIVTSYLNRFEIPFYEKSEFEVCANYPLFPYINSYQSDTYDNFIVQCNEIINQYPDSRFLLGGIVEFKTLFQTKESMQKLFNSFSKKNQQTDFGKIIDEYIKNFFVFSNIKLPRYDNDRLEFLIQDSTKINMIVFPASWCAPCHEMIPSLKEIYNDLKDQLDITYISMDEEKTADNWRKLMKEQAIPWRSLMAEQNIKTVRETYNPSGAIPFALLVYPNKTVEIIDIRQDDQKGKIYSICNSFSVH